MFEKSLSNFLQALEPKNFFAWIGVAEWEQLPQGCLRLNLPANPDLDAAIAQLWTAVQRRGPKEAELISLSSLLAACIRISRGEDAQHRSLSQFLGEQLAYFDRAVLSVAGVTLAEVTGAEFPSSNPAAALDVVRTALSEFLRNLWQWLNEHRYLPFIPDDEIDEIAEQAIANLKQIADLPKLGLLIETLFATESASIPKLQAHWIALVEQEQRTGAETLDARLRSAAHIQFKDAMRFRSVSEAKSAARDQWRTALSDCDSFVRIIGLPWTAQEKSELAPRLAGVLADPSLPQAIKNHALLRLIAWGMEADAVAGAMALGPMSTDGVSVLADVINTVRFPPLGPEETVPDWRLQALTHHKKEGSEHALLIFPGGLSTYFGLPRELLHRLLLPAAMHLLYVHDESNRVFLAGVPGVGGNYEETIDGLRKVLNALGVQHVHVLGFSGFAFSAIQYALDLNADSVLCYSPRTCMTASFLRNDRAARYFGQVLRKVVPEARHDLRSVLLKRPQPPRVLVRYGEGDDIDSFHAENLAGVPGVSLRPHRGWTGHNSLIASLLRKEFEEDLAFLSA